MACLCKDRGTTAKSQQRYVAMVLACFIRMGIASSQQQRFTSVIWSKPAAKFLALLLYTWYGRHVRHIKRMADGLWHTASIYVVLLLLHVEFFHQYVGWMFALISAGIAVPGTCYIGDYGRIFAPRRRYWCHVIVTLACCCCCCGCWKKLDAT